MAESSPGATAQIITHARFDRTPVVQAPRRGRFPKNVIAYWRVRNSVQLRRSLAQEQRQEIEDTRQRLIDHRYLVGYFQGRLSLLEQQWGANV